MAPLSGTDIAAIVLGIAAYLTINIVGTVYYTKLNKNQPLEVSDSLMDWNLCSVILGWLLIPPLNLSSSITYGMYYDEDAAALADAAKEAAKKE
jgi:hypothetical protein